ncbi:hypothetical protein PMAYCL1PPCAC_03511, partial [Pristionchus mayeri]
LFSRTLSYKQHSGGVRYRLADALLLSAGLLHDLRADFGSVDGIIGVLLERINDRIDEVVADVPVVSLGEGGLAPFVGLSLQETLNAVNVVVDEDGQVEADLALGVVGNSVAVLLRELNSDADGSTVVVELDSLRGKCQRGAEGNQG